MCVRVWLLVQQSYSHYILYIHLIKSRRAFPNQLTMLYAKGWTRYNRENITFGWTQWAVKHIQSVFSYTPLSN